jgi:hypothetical protein
MGVPDPSACRLSLEFDLNEGCRCAVTLDDVLCTGTRRGMATRHPLSGTCSSPMTILALGPLTFESSPDPVRGAPPSGEARHVVGRPRSVTGHRALLGCRRIASACAQTSHRLAVALVEKWLDVSVEVEGRVGGGRLVRISGASVVAFTGRCESARRGPSRRSGQPATRRRPPGPAPLGRAPARRPRSRSLERRRRSTGAAR